MGENIAKKRCAWVPLDNPLYLAYHDQEWGKPLHDDRELFGLLVLEGAQAGLSWLTVLKKRERYREVSAGWDIDQVAAFDEAKVEELLQDPGIIRNRLKVNSAINNARRVQEVQKEFGSFSDYLWGWVDNKPIVNGFKKDSEIPASTPLSDALAKDMKKRGFKFVGTTIMYAFMQSMGMVNDHLVDCFRYQELVGGGRG